MTNKLLSPLLRLIYRQTVWACYCMWQHKQTAFDNIYEQSSKRHNLLKFTNTMKKIVCLLLITLLFTSCKKNKNQHKYATNEISIKGKWEFSREKVNYFDADGNLVYTETIEYDRKPFIYMKFDDNDKSYFKLKNNSREKISAYTYQNGCLTFNIDKENSNKVFVAKLTANSMTWQLEATNEKRTPENLSPQDPVLQQIVKHISYLNLIKVN